MHCSKTYSCVTDLCYALTSLCHAMTSISQSTVKADINIYSSVDAHVHVNVQQPSYARQGVNPFMMRISIISRGWLDCCTLLPRCMQQLRLHCNLQEHSSPTSTRLADHDRFSATITYYTYWYMCTAGASEQYSQNLPTWVGDQNRYGFTW